MVFKRPDYGAKKINFYQVTGDCRFFVTIGIQVIHHLLPK